jgi:hypothetical protein
MLPGWWGNRITQIKRIKRIRPWPRIRVDRGVQGRRHAHRSDYGLAHSAGHPSADERRAGSHGDGDRDRHGYWGGPNPPRDPFAARPP